MVSGYFNVTGEVGRIKERLGELGFRAFLCPVVLMHGGMMHAHFRAEDGSEEEVTCTIKSLFDDTRVVVHTVGSESCPADPDPACVVEGTVPVLNYVLIPGRYEIPWDGGRVVATVGTYGSQAVGKQEVYIAEGQKIAALALLRYLRSSCIGPGNDPFATGFYKRIAR